jgi:predicted DNA-binding transcriptional regulator YafY
MKIDRLLSIIVILLNRGRITAPELAKRFGVSVRTIYRDLESIGRAGVPVSALQGKKGGYGIMEGFTIERGIFSEYDIASMRAALKGMNAVLEDGEIDGAIEKLSALVRAGSRGLSDEIVLDMEPWGYSAKRTAKIDKLRRAISGRIPVKIGYRDSNGNTSERVVEPVSLVLKNGVWYLYAFCRLRSDERLFRLSGIRSSLLLLERFPPRDLSYADFAKRTFAEPPLTEFVVEFDKSAGNTVEDSYDPESIEKLPGSGLRVKMRMPESEWVYDMILGYGTKARLVGPAHAVEGMKAHLRNIIDQYNKSE